MKKIIYILALSLIVIYGCAEEAPEVIEVEPVVEVEEVVEEIPDNIYKIGDEVTIGGESFIISFISQDGEIVLKQDNLEILLEGTNNRAKVNNQEVWATKLDLALDSSERTIELNIEDIELGDNDYIFDLDTKIEILGKNVQLVDIDTDSLESISIRVTDDSESITERINKGETIEILGLKVTNIRSNPRAITYEKYAIVGVE